MKISVTLVNEDKDMRFSEWSEDTDEDMTSGELFRACREEYGRCTSSVYIDTPDGAKRIGWYFVKRDQYERGEGSYLRGAWVTFQ